MSAQLWVTLAIAVVQGILVPLVMGVLREHRRQVNELTARIEKLDDRIDRLPRDYVMKDDYVRSIVGFERALCDIQTSVQSIANNLQVHIGLGQAAATAGQKEAA